MPSLPASGVNLSITAPEVNEVLDTLTESKHVIVTTSKAESMSIRCFDSVHLLLNQHGQSYVVARLLGYL